MVAPTRALGKRSVCRSGAVALGVATGALGATRGSCGMSTSAELRSELTDVIARSAFLLDEHRFGEWIDLTAADFRYRIQAYSPDIRRDMTWLDHDRAGMVALIELLPKHHVDGADLLRQVSVGEVQRESATEASSVSSLSIFYTARDIGDSHVDGGS